MDLIRAIRAGQSSPPSGIRTLTIDQTHNWLVRVDPGEIEMVWKVDDRYLNLEGAVIAPWTMALADQALFFASNTLCGLGEGTRLERFAFTAERNIHSGVDLRIVATIETRIEDLMHGRCDFFVDGELMVGTSAEIRVIHSA